MARPAWLQYKTARCILSSADRYLLVVHHAYLPRQRGRWGLPGGRIEWGESAEAAARREVAEELGRITLGPLVDCGDYRYKSARHKVFGARFDGVIEHFDSDELERIGWHSLDDVAAFARDQKLHGGFEHEAIAAFVDALKSADERPR